MSPREALVTETREWLDRARADLHACAALIAAGLPAEALLHAQQCAEKAMKAVPGDASVHLAGIERPQYAWRFRYPGAPYSAEETEAEEARHAAGRLLEAVAAQLESPFGEHD